MKTTDEVRVMAVIRFTGIILLLLACVGCNRGNTRLLPRQLEGVWTSDDARYQGRFLELSPAFVIIVTGPQDKPSVQLVDKVESAPSEMGTAFKVYSSDSKGNHYQMELQFNPSKSEIRFNNQSQVWKRKNVL